MISDHPLCAHTLVHVYRQLIKVAASQAKTADCYQLIYMAHFVWETSKSVAVSVCRLSVCLSRVRSQKLCEIGPRREISSPVGLCEVGVRQQEYDVGFCTVAPEVYSPKFRAQKSARAYSLAVLSDAACYRVTLTMREFTGGVYMQVLTWAVQTWNVEFNRRLPDTSASRHSETLRHRSQDTSTPKTWYETLRHECRDQGKAGTLRPKTIPMRHS